VPDGPRFADPCGKQPKMTGRLVRRRQRQNPISIGRQCERYAIAETHRRGAVGLAEINGTGSSPALAVLSQLDQAIRKARLAADGKLGLLRIGLQLRQRHWNINVKGLL
jgi:hypothetical protein